MVNQELLDYIKKELARGVSEDKLRHVLMEHGWPEFEIYAAFEKVHEVPVAPPKTEKVIEEKPEDVLKEITKEAMPEKKLDFLEEKPVAEKPEEKLVEEHVEKPKKLSFEMKKIIFSKVFLIIGAVIILVSVAYFVAPLFFHEQAGSSEKSVMDYAKNMCRQYCQSSLCGLFTNPDFKHEELLGKTCKDLGISCLQEDGKPKCETSY